MRKIINTVSGITLAICMLLCLTPVLTVSLEIAHCIVFLASMIVFSLTAKPNFER